MKKEIVKSSLIESIAVILIQSAIKFSNGMIAKWFVYPIEFAVLFVGILLANIAFKRYMDKVVFGSDEKTS